GRPGAFARCVDRRLLAVRLFLALLSHTRAPKRCPPADLQCRAAHRTAGLYRGDAQRRNGKWPLGEREDGGSKMEDGRSKALRNSPSSIIHPPSSIFSFQAVRFI